MANGEQAGSVEMQEYSQYPPPGSMFRDEFVDGVLDLPRDAEQVRGSLLDGLLADLQIAAGNSLGEQRLVERVERLKQKAVSDGERYQEQLLTTTLARMIELKDAAQQANGVAEEYRQPVKIQFLIRQYVDRSGVDVDDPPEDIVSIRMGHNALSGSEETSTPSSVQQAMPPDVIIIFA